MASFVLTQLIIIHGVGLITMFSVPFLVLEINDTEHEEPKLRRFNAFSKSFNCVLFVLLRSIKIVKESLVDLFCVGTSINLCNVSDILHHINFT